MYGLESIPRVSIATDTDVVHMVNTASRIVLGSMMMLIGISIVVSLAGITLGSFGVHYGLVRNQKQKNTMMFRAGIACAVGLFICIFPYFNFVGAIICIIGGAIAIHNRHLVDKSVLGDGSKPAGDKDQTAK